MQAWILWKQATDHIWGEVARRITAATGLSAADFSVLTRAAEADHPPRQQDLADALGWTRSRLSRQLSRMEARGLITRCTTPTSTTVQVTESGQALAAAARTTHAEAVRAALLSRIPKAENASFWTTITSLSSPSSRS
jgi:DNA-binding MarR family transcriptional regulator